tara:strand:+ start:446 stop:1399 length:954 start_codon:yes stop_codon:yes gene_type:complete
LVKRKILIVGFGSMGCRHAQSFLNRENDYEIHILEPYSDNIEKNLNLINSRRNDFIWHKNINHLPILDIAIVATSSNPRFEIVKSLINLGYKKILLEKVVFQSEKQFNVIIKMINEAKAVIYCNFVNRYFKAYNNIKKQLNQKNEKVSIDVHGGPFGLGCNAIHYIDIFQYLLNEDVVKLKKCNLHLFKNGNKRGSIYKEFYGEIKLCNGKGDIINIISDLEYKGDITINIKQGNREFLLDQGKGELLTSTNSEKTKNDFIIIPSSSLTHIIVEDIFKNKCGLTQLEQTVLAHTALFKAFNSKINIKHSSETLCPIT